MHVQQLRSCMYASQKAASPFVTQLMDVIGSRLCCCADCFAYCVVCAVLQGGLVLICSQGLSMVHHHGVSAGHHWPAHSVQQLHWIYPAGSLKDCCPAGCQRCTGDTEQNSMVAAAGMSACSVCQVRVSTCCCRVKGFWLLTGCVQCSIALAQPLVRGTVHHASLSLTQCLHM